MNNSTPVKGQPSRISAQDPSDGAACTSSGKIGWALLWLLGIPLPLLLVLFLILG